MILKSNEEWLPVEGVLPVRHPEKSNIKVFELILVVVLITAAIMTGLYITSELKILQMSSLSNVNSNTKTPSMMAGGPGGSNPSPGIPEVDASLAVSINETASPLATPEETKAPETPKSPEITASPVVAVAVTPSPTSAGSPEPVVISSPVKTPDTPTPTYTRSPYTPTPVFTKTPEKPKIYDTKVELTFENEIELKDNLHRLSLREVLEKDNWSVTWNQKTKNVVAVKGDSYFEIDYGKQQFSHKDKKSVKSESVPVYIKDGHVMVPYRFLAARLDNRLTLEPETREVSLMVDADTAAVIALHTPKKPKVTVVETPIPTPTKLPVTTPKPVTSPVKVAVKPTVRVPEVKKSQKEVELKFDVDPELKDDLHMISFRSVMEQDDWTVKWDPDNKNAVAWKNSKKFEIIPEKKQFLKKVNEEMKKEDAKVYIKNGRIMVPYRFLSSHLKGRVRLEQDTKKVYLQVEDMPHSHH